MSDFSSPSQSLPSERDLDRLTSAIRIAAIKRGFPRLVTDLYQDWIFLYIAWCLNAPPHRIHRSRIGDFFKALNQRDVNATKVCRAMDALAFFFGGVGGPEEVLFCPGTLSPIDSDAFDVTEVIPRRSRAYYRRVTESSHVQSNVAGSELDTSATDDEVSSAARTSEADLARYLPDGALPETVKARAVIPTREGPEPSGEATARAADAPPIPPASGSADQRNATPDSEVMHRTLFNPEGISPRREEETSNAESDPSNGQEDVRESDATAHEEVERLLSDLGLSLKQISGAQSVGEEFEITPVTEDDFSIKIPITVKIPSPLITFLRTVAHRRGSATVVCTSSDDAQEDIEVTIESTAVVDSEHGTEQGRVIILHLEGEATEG